jgi:hypothetical protein
MFAKAAARFGDARAGEVREELDSLQSVIAGIYKNFSDAAAGSDEMRIPLTPDGKDEAFRKAGYFDLAQGFVLRMGLECGYVPECDVMKVYNWHLRNGKASEKGLCANHPSKKNLADKHIWYTTYSEQHWYNCFNRIGRGDLAKRVFDAIMKYSITDECYVGERYRDDNPWYFPWSPNASGSATRAVSRLPWVWSVLRTVPVSISNPRHSNRQYSQRVAGTRSVTSKAADKGSSAKATAGMLLFPRQTVRQVAAVITTPRMYRLGGRVASIL